MQLAHCCEIFDIFIFILVPLNEIPCEFLTLFPIHRGVCRHFALCSHSERHSRYCCVHFDVHKMQFRGMKQKNETQNRKNVEKCNNKFDNFNTFGNPQPLIVFTTKIFHSLLWWNIILAKRAEKKLCYNNNRKCNEICFFPRLFSLPSLVEQWFLC